MPGYILILGDTFTDKESCFNQRTGEPQKWYVVDERGVIELFDSPGFDKFGNKKQVVTTEICKQYYSRQTGIQHGEFEFDPATTVFFDQNVGTPLVWYSIDEDGNYHLFPSPGFDPILRLKLEPVTREAVERIKFANSQRMKLRQQFWAIDVATPISSRYRLKTHGANEFRSKFLACWEVPDLSTSFTASVVVTIFVDSKRRSSWPAFN